MLTVLYYFKAVYVAPLEHHKSEILFRNNPRLSMKHYHTSAIFRPNAITPATTPAPATEPITIPAMAPPDSGLE